MKSDEHVRIQVETSIVVATGISDPGRIRSENEDSIMLDESGNFMLLADGMGGHDAGDVASGVYFYRLDAGEYSAVRRMVLMK